MVGIILELRPFSEVLGILEGHGMMVDKELESVGYLLHMPPEIGKENK